MFGISLTPYGLFMAFVIALILLFTPIWIVTAIAHQFPDPINSIIQIVGIYLVIPLLLTYVYKNKFYNQNKGSAIFWIYTGMYTLIFVNSFTHLFSKPLSFETIIAPIVTGFVSFYMIRTSFKIKKQYQKDLEAYHREIREDDIKKQAEAILLAEELKQKQEK